MRVYVTNTSKHLNVRDVEWRRVNFCTTITTCPRFFSVISPLHRMTSSYKYKIRILELKSSLHTDNILLRCTAEDAAEEERSEDDEDDGHDDGIPVRAQDGEGRGGRAGRGRRRARRAAVQARAARLALRPTPSYY